MVLEKILEYSLDCKIKPVNPKGNQSKYSLKGLMLKLQYFGHLMGRADSLEKTLMLGKIEGSRRRGRQRMRWLDGITDSMDMSLIPELGRSPEGGSGTPLQYSCLGNPMDRGDWWAAVCGVAKESDTT